MVSKIRVLIPFILIAGGIVAVIWFLHDRSAAESDSIYVSGNIEVTSVEVSFKIPGRIEKRPVDEGEEVKFGQLIAVLDSAMIEQEVSLRKAELRAAQSALAELAAGNRPEEIAQAQAIVEKEKLNLMS